jgi:hypothetical protein
VGCCSVEITGKDGKKHILTTDASSTFDAVAKAVQAWSRLWWWDSDTIAIVRRNDESWNVPTRRVIERRRP